MVVGVRHVHRYSLVEADTYRFAELPFLGTLLTPEGNRLPLLVVDPYLSHLGIRQEQETAHTPDDVGALESVGR